MSYMASISEGLHHVDVCAINYCLYIEIEVVVTLQMRQISNKKTKDVESNNHINF